MSKPCKGKKVKYHLRNKSKYNNTLKQRGQIVFMLTSDIKSSWLVEELEIKKPGANPKFSDLAIETCLKIRYLFKMPLRHEEGFIYFFASINTDSKFYR